MTKICPECGKELPDKAQFCMNCGYNLEKDNNKRNSHVFSNGYIFIALIVVVLIIGGILIATSGFVGNDSSDNVSGDMDVSMTITEVNGWVNDNDNNKSSYTLYTYVIFNRVPGNLKDYNIKTTYYNSSDEEIGHEIENLDNIYHDASYPIGIGYYTTYKLPDPEKVSVEIIKDGKVVGEFKENIDKNKLSFLN